MIFRGFTYRMCPTDAQAQVMAQATGVCRLVWNLALEQRRDHWRQYQRATGNNLNYVTQARELTALRREIDFVRAVHVTPQQRALKALDDAFRRFFAGVGGYPKPKRKGAHDAFSHAGREIAVETINRRWGRVRLPKIGWVKFRLARPVGGEIREATVTRTALGWHISFGCLINRTVADPGGAVGVDRGVAVPLMLSNGVGYELPDRIAVLDRRARKAQRVASRRKRGSVRHAKAQGRVSALRARQARARADWAHRTTTDITRRYGTVIVERLRTRNMTRRAAGTIEAPGRNVAQKRGLNRAILNVGWHQIECMLAYKAARFVRVDPTYTSQTCAACGAIDPKSRESQARFRCRFCGHTANADVNAAINILHRGNAPGVEASQWAADETRTVQGAQSSWKSASFMGR